MAWKNDPIHIAVAQATGSPPHSVPQGHLLPQALDSVEHVVSINVSPSVGCVRIP